MGLFPFLPGVADAGLLETNCQTGLVSCHQCPASCPPGCLPAASQEGPVFKGPVVRRGAANCLAPCGQLSFRRGQSPGNSGLPVRTSAKRHPERQWQVKESTSDHSGDSCCFCCPVSLSPSPGQGTPFSGASPPQLSVHAFGWTDSLLG